MLSRFTYFIFAHYVKLGQIINSHGEATNLQTDINNIQAWCLSNRLFLNNNKCKFMCFTSKQNPINFNYSMSKPKSWTMKKIKKNGILSDSKLNFSTHTKIIVRIKLCVI